MTPSIPDTLTAAALPADDLKDGGVYLTLKFTGLDLSGRGAAGAEFEECRLINVGLSQAKLRRAMLRDTAFDGCDLANLRARDCQLSRATVAACRMTGLSWLSGAIRDTTFSGCRIDLASFRGSKFTDVVFSGCRMEQVDFGDCDLRGARFEDCDLSGAQFNSARMEGTRFADCTLNDIGGVTSLRGATVSGQDVFTLTFTLANALGITIEHD